MKKIFISVLMLVILALFVSCASAFQLENDRLSFQMPQREIYFDSGRMENRFIFNSTSGDDGVNAYFFGKNLVFRLLALVLPEPLASSLSNSIRFTEEFAVQVDNYGSPDSFHQENVSIVILFTWKF